jgi:hypothetical protein
MASPSAVVVVGGAAGSAGGFSPALHATQSASSSGDMSREGMVFMNDTCE